MSILITTKTIVMVFILSSQPSHQTESDGANNQQNSSEIQKKLESSDCLQLFPELSLFSFNQPKGTIERVPGSTYLNSLVLRDPKTHSFS